MAYTKQTWNNGLAGSTPLSAARLNYIEDGIEAAANSGGSAGLSAITVAPAGASAEILASADFACDGVADDVTIEAAITASYAIVDYSQTYTGADGAISGFAGEFGPVQNASRLSNQLGPTATDTTTMMLALHTKTVAPGEAIEADITWNSGEAGVVWALNSSYGSAGLQGIYAYVDGTNVKLIDAPNSNDPDTQTPIASASMTLVSGNTYRLGVSRSSADLWTVTVDAVVKISTTYTPAPTLSFANEYRGVFSTDSGGNNRIDNLAIPQASNGGEVHILPGAYYLSDSINVIGPATIVGSDGGTTFYMSSMPAASAGFIITDTQTTIRNITFNGTGLASAVAGIRAEMNFTEVDGCRFISFTDRNGVELLTSDSWVKNCYFESCRAGVVVQDWNNRVSGCTFKTVTKGVYMQHALGVTVTNNDFYNGDYLVFADDEFGYSDSGEHTVVGNTISYPGATDGASIHMEYQFNVAITGNNIQEGGDFGIRMFQCSNGVISGNVISFFNQDGILLQGCDDMLVVGNNLSEANGDNVSAALIRVSDSGGATPVTGNRNTIVHNLLRVASPLTGDEWYGNVPRYGIRIESAVTGTIVYGNDVRGSDFVIPIYDSGSGTLTTNASGNWT